MENTPSSSVALEDLLAHAHFVRALARGLLDTHEADDVIQETWLAALVRPPGPRVSLTAWLAAVVRNLARRARRTHRRRERREIATAPREELPSTGELVERMDSLAQVVTAVRQLGAPYRAVILLRFYEGLSHGDIARRQGIAVEAVRTRVSRALAQLRDRLDGEHRGDRRSWQLALLPFATAKPTGSLVTPRALAGALVMSVKMKVSALVIAALVLVTGGLVWWRQLARDLSPSPAHELVGAGTSSDGASRPERTEMESPAVRSDVAPPAVDLARADRDRDLFGRVTETGGAPIAAAEVRAIIRPWRRVEVLHELAEEDAITQAQASTAGDGTFALRLARGQQVDVRVAKASYGTVELPQRLAGEQVMVTLARAAELEVHVTDEAGQPVRDATVQCFRSLDQSMISYDERRATTGEDGDALIGDLAPGPAQVRVMHARLQARGWRDVRLAASQRTELDVTLALGKPIHGRVTDADTGLPIEGARVGESWLLERSVASDARGAYAFPGWSGTKLHELCATKDGYGRQCKRVLAEGDVDFALEAGDRVAGTIRAVTGDPIGGALVAAVASQWPSGSQVIDARSSKTRDDGRFLLTGLRRDLPHTLVVQASGHARYLLDFDPHPLAAGLIELGDITLPAPRSIEGLALDAEQKPIAGAQVTLVGANPDRGRLRPESAAPATAESYGREETRRTDDLGRFRFPELAAGEYRLTLEMNGCPPAHADITLPPDHDVLDAILRIASGARLTVLVTNEEAQPLAGVRVLARWAPQGQVSMATDEHGRATFAGLPQSAVRIAVMSPGPLLAPAPVSAVPEGQEIALVLVEPGHIAGVLLGPDGNPLANMEVLAVDPAHTGSTGQTNLLMAAEGAARDAARAAYTDGTGAFDLQVPRETLVDLEVRGRQRVEIGEAQSSYSLSRMTPYRAEQRGVVAPASGIMLRAREISRDRTLEVTVVDPDGNPVALAEVVANGGGVLVRGETDAQGHATLTGLSADQVAVSAHSSQLYNAPEPVIEAARISLLPDGQRITLALRRGAKITGRAIDPKGNAVAGAMVHATSGDEAFVGGLTDDHGRFQIVLPAGGTYQVSAWRDGLAGSVKDVSPQDGEITVALKAGP
jgi:RNA polymerase sigma-70 factor (ECF subfamily)